MSMTVKQAIGIAHDYYEDYYDNPRAVSYFELSNQLGSQNLVLLDFVADALDLGVKDQRNDVEKREQDDVIERIGGIERLIVGE